MALPASSLKWLTLLVCSNELVRSGLPKTACMIDAMSRMASRRLSGSQGVAAHVLAVLNSCVLALFEFCHVHNAKQHMRRLDAQPLQAVCLLLKSPKENYIALGWVDGWLCFARL
jgi:hypothetical protein